MRGEATSSAGSSQLRRLPSEVMISAAHSVFLRSFPQIFLAKERLLASSLVVRIFVCSKVHVHSRVLCVTY